MNFNDVQEFRYACKRYDSSKNVCESAMLELVKGASLTATSCNLQPYHLLVFNKSDDLEKLKEVCYNQGTIRTCSNAIVVLASKKSHTGPKTKRYDTVIEGLTNRLNSFLPDDKKMSKQQVFDNTSNFADKEDHEFLEWSKMNCYMVATNIMNKAASLGIDSCPLEGFNQAIFSKYFPEYDDDFAVAMVITLGYRDEEQPYRSRLDIDSTYTIM